MIAVLNDRSAAIELAIFISQGIWLVRTRKLHKQAKSMGVDFDSLPEARRYQWPRYTDEDDTESRENKSEIIGSGPSETSPPPVKTGEDKQ